MNLTTEEEIPQVLYKYRDFSESTRDYVRQIIVENKVRFSSPADLNDPFDCKVHASFKGTVREYKKDMLRLLKKYKPGLNRQQRQAENVRIFKKEKRHRRPDLFRMWLPMCRRNTTDGESIAFQRGTIMF